VVWGEDGDWDGLERGGGEVRGGLGAGSGSGLVGRRNGTGLVWLEDGRGTGPVWEG